jgi:hypothetical protein
MIKKSFGKILTGTLQDIYEVPTTKTTQWVLLYISNTAGANGTVDVNFYDASETATLPVLSGYAISAKTFFQIGEDFNSFIRMEAGDKITASSTQTMTLLMSVVEEDITVQGG